MARAARSPVPGDAVTLHHALPLAHAAPTIRRCCCAASSAHMLQHDLRHDLRRACQVIMQAQRALPGPIMARPSSVQVITPYNVPAALLPGDGER